MRPEDFKRRLVALAPKSGECTRLRAEVPTAATDNGTATIRLYDPIDSWGWDWGVSAKEFAACLDSLPSQVQEIRLHINSPGGEVFDAIAISNALRSHSARVVAIVDGLAASAASFIAASADELIMAPNSELMIHDAWGLCMGNAADMQSMAEMLDHTSNNIASIYAAKAGTEVAPWRAAMSAETWYSAEEAVAAGLADSVAQPAAPAPQNRFDLSAFTYAGREAAPPPPPLTKPDQAEPPAAEVDDLAARVNAFRHLVAATRL